MRPILKDTLAALVLSGRVQRYHTIDTVRKQSVGEHTYGVVWLCAILTEGGASRDLLLAALWHDTAEFATGDIPSPVKRLCGEAFDIFETSAEEALGIHVALDVADASILKLADLIEGALFCLSEAQRGNFRAVKHCSRNYIQYLCALLEEVSCPVGDEIAAWLGQQFHPYFTEEAS